jgi:hypothetical protein
LTAIRADSAAGVVTTRTGRANAKTVAPTESFLPTSSNLRLRRTPWSEKADRSLGDRTGAAAAATEVRRFASEETAAEAATAVKAVWIALLAGVWRRPPT